MQSTTSGEPNRRRLSARAAARHFTPNGNILGTDVRSEAELRVAAESTLAPGSRLSLARSALSPRQGTTDPGSRWSGRISTAEPQWGPGGLLRASGGTRASRLLVGVCVAAGAAALAIVTMYAAGPTAGAGIPRRAARQAGARGPHRRGGDGRPETGQERPLTRVLARPRSDSCSASPAR